MKNIILVLKVTFLGSWLLAQPIDHGLDLHFMDHTVRPQEDFYQFANGGWLQQTEIPSDHGRWSGFNELRDYTDSVTLAVLQQAMEKGLQKGTDQRKAADLFEGYMDMEARNKLGLTPLKPYLESIEQVKSLKDLADLNAEWAPYGGLFFGLSVYADLKNSNWNTAYIGGPELGMGRDYYQKDDEESASKLSKYEEHVARMLDFINPNQDNKQKAKQIVDLEKRMAKSLLTVVERRDARKQYNKMSVTELDSKLEVISIPDYLAKIGAKTDTLIVSEFAYIHELNAVLKETPLSILKDYARWSLLNRSTSMLDATIDDANFEFYGKVLRGVEEQRPLEERALANVNGSIGEAVGKLYVKDVFPPEAKQEAKKMVEYIKKAFEIHIKKLTWMSDATKEKALEKLAKFNVKIGYPDKWRDYSAMKIVPLEDGGTHFGNQMAVAKWAYEDRLSELNQEVDKTRWGMSPQTVNAYYSPVSNEIVFPAAILQPPFFNFKADAAVNFGGMGAVIGHEISHGFDDSGARFDGNGNLNNWWSEEDAKKFEAAGKALAAQYSSYEPFPGITVNGEFTLGENIGDLGGVNVAYTGLQLFMQDEGRTENISGFTPEQRFFLSWATVWRTKYKDEALKNQIKTDPHSPGMYRAVGPLVNIDSFFKAFGIQPDDPMFKPENERVKIW